MIKRYAVFKVPFYYPGGGMRDFVKSFNDIAEATAFAAGLEDRLYDIDLVDLEEYE